MKPKANIKLFEILTGVVNRPVPQLREDAAQLPEIKMEIKRTENRIEELQNFVLHIPCSRCESRDIEMDIEDLQIYIADQELKKGKCKIAKKKLDEIEQFNKKWVPVIAAHRGRQH